MTIVLIIALFLFAYPLFIYPVLLRLLYRREPPRPLQPLDSYPTVALLICAYNEERIIAEKIRNALALKYPEGKLRIVVVSDGSTDRTAEVVREEGGGRVTLIAQPKRRGKIKNVNETVMALTEDIVVSTDANVLCDPHAILALVRNFEDPTVGCVSGRIVVTNTLQELRDSEKQVFSIEWFLQQCACRIYSMAGVDGAMYAFRRRLFRKLRDDTVIEDFVMSIGFVRQAGRIVFEPMALAREDGAVSVKEEYRRKVRIAAGAAQALLRGEAWPIGTPIRFWFIFLSHKLLRWLTPVTGILAVAIAALRPVNLPALGVILAALGMAVATLLRAVTKWRHPLLDGPFYFVLSQAALAVGLGKGLTGTQSVLWAKPNR